TRRFFHRGHNKGKNRPGVTQAGTAGGCNVKTIEHDSFQPAAADYQPVVCLRGQARQRRGNALEKKIKKTPHSPSTQKNKPHFWPSAVDFCCSRVAIGAATERERALAMPAGTRAQALQTRL